MKKITDAQETFILYPQSDIDNIKKFSGDLNNLPLIYELENSRYTVKAPFGTDTYILITTDTRIPDLKALQMPGVATDVRGNTFDEFTNYITGTNSIKKRGDCTLSTSWSVRRIIIESRKK